MIINNLMEPPGVLLTFILILFLILLYFYSRQNLKYWKVRGVPYVKPIPFFGNIYSVLSQKQSFSDFLSYTYAQFKHPYLGFYLLEEPYLLIRDYNIFKHVLVKDFEHFTNRSVLHNTTDEYARHLLFTLPGQEWKDLRTKVTPMFSTKKLKAMLPLINEVGDNLLYYLEKNIVSERADCLAACTRYGIDLIASCAFGLTSGCLKQENSTFYSMCAKFFDYGDVLHAIQMVSHFCIPSIAKFLHMKFLHPEASRFMDKIVTDTIKDRIEKQYTREDLIDILVGIQQRDKSFAIDPKKLPVVAIQFLIGGYESSAGTITFLLYELSQNQTIQNRLRDEILSVHKKYGEFSFEAIKEMEYLDMVVKETLRIYPLLPFLDRRCVKTYKVPNTNLVIDKGVGLYISVHGLHHDPENFPNPEKFDPERFSEENKSSLSHEAFIPFGHGMRNCIGIRLAYLSVKLAVIKILTTYKIDKSFDTPVPLPLASNWLFIAPKSKSLYLNFKKIDCFIS